MHVMPAPAIASRATENILVPSPFGVAFATVDMRVGVRGEWQADLSEEDDRLRGIQRVRGLAWDTDGSLMVAASNKLRRFDADGRERWRWNPGANLAFVIASPQAVTVVDERILVVCDDGTMALLDEDGTVLARRKDDAAPRWIANVNGVPVGTDGITLTRWDYQDLEPTAQKTLSEKAMGFAANDRYVATRGLRTAKIFDAETLELVADFPTGGGLPILALHPERPEVALADLRSIRIFDFTGVQIAERPVEGPVTALAYLEEALLFSGDHE